MPSTNKRINKSSSTVKTKRSKKITTNQPLNKTQLVISLAVFAVFGAVLLSRSFADGGLPVSSNELLTSYVKTNPTNVTHDIANDTYNVISISEAYAVRGDGTLQCDAGTGSQLTEGKLPANILKGLNSEVAALDINDAPASALTDTKAVVGNELYVLSTKNEIITKSVKKDTAKPDKLAKMQDKIVKICQKYATKQGARGNRKEFKKPDRRSSQKQTSMLDNLVSFLNQKAEATASTVYPPAGFTLETGLANDQRAKTNNYRASRGLPSLTQKFCLDTVAANWAIEIAKAGTLSHNPQIGANMAQFCGGEGFKYNTANTNKQDGSNTWQSISENVGMAGNSDQLFAAYVASPTHNANLLNTNAKCQGHGAYRNPTNGLYYHVFVSASWVGADCRR